MEAVPNIASDGRKDALGPARYSQSCKHSEFSIANPRSEALFCLTSTGGCKLIDEAEKRFGQSLWKHAEN